MKAMRKAVRHVLRAAVAGACCAGAVMLATSAIARDIDAGVKERVFVLDIKAGALPAPQRLIKVTKGDNVRWQLSSDTAGDLHIHGYRLEARLVAGGTAELAFKAFATGRFRIEWHPADAKGAKKGDHHGPPLGTLEVHPR